MKRRCCLAVLLALSQFASAQQSSSSLRVERLAELGKLWVNIRYFHPYLAYRDIDWDAAFANAVPKVNAAASPAEYAAAVQGMLDALGDPLTRVDTKDAKSSAKSGALHAALNDDGILLITVAGSDYRNSIQALRQAAAQIPKARGIVFDLRAPIYHSLVFAQSGVDNKFSSTPVVAPGTRTRMHHGYASEDGLGFPGYHSAFQVADGERFPGSPQNTDAPVVFLISEQTALPPIALALHGAGKAAIVAEGRARLDQLLEDPYTVELPSGVRVVARLGELIYPDGSGIGAPDAVAATPEEAMRVALSLAKQPTQVSARKQLPAIGSQLSPHGMGPQDAGHRVLAAVQIWGVFHYFFPYKDLMGEDWDAVLREFIPRMEAADEGSQYFWAVAEMVSHVHDSHVTTAPLFHEILSGAPPPVYAQWIEGSPVIAGFYADSASQSGIAVGDVVLKVDGEDAKARMDSLKNYISASTPQALMWKVMERFMNGPDNSTAVLTLRGGSGQVKDVKVTRSRSLLVREFEQRSGEIMKLLPGNIGYADLDRLRISMVDAMFEQFKATKAIIFDMRGYPYETAEPIASRLTQKEHVPAALVEEPLVEHPSQRGEQPLSRSRLHFIPFSDKPHYKGKTVMLINELAGSQAEHSGLFFEAANGTRFIGSPTAGANGDITNFTVPGGIRITFSGHGVRHADGRQLQRVGLLPDIEVRPTIQGIREGRDEVLERAIEYLKATQ
jgi:C-terminal processing protease CtpA/Prc